MPKVSVIIPVYGVEKYIERCARSLFSQTLKDMEFIFVNDCTPDLSISVLYDVIKDYPERESQIKIINHKENRGLPMARKTGIYEANGEYIAHCDSDDWVEINMYETLYNIASVHNNDIVFCDYYQYLSDSSMKHVKKNISYDLNNRDLLLKILVGKNHLNPIWSALIKRTIMFEKGLIFPVNNMGEDWVVMVQCLYYSKLIDYIEKPLYHYCYNQNSITKSTGLDHILNRLQQTIINRKLIYDFLEKKGEYNCLSDYIVASKYYCRLPLLKLKRKDNIKKLWNSTFPEINKSILQNRNITLRKKIFHVLVNANIWKPF